MGLDDYCNTGLILGLGFPPSTGEHKRSPPPQKLRRFSDEPSLTLSLSGDHDHIHNTCGVDGSLFRQDSDVSSFSSSAKREDDDDGDDDGSNASGRKKLRLSKAQSSLLEESFKLHTTLNPKQKQELARDLVLRPRQVEVWFQNRRARTKLKQTEVDCEFLKKCCEKLTDENRRLQKELKVLKLAQPLYMQLPPAVLTIMCPSCEQVGGGPGTVAPKPQFYNHFTNSSAAC